jgi:hypothetical protein
MSGSVVGIVVLALLWGAFQLSHRKKLARLEQLIRDQRALTLLPINYEPVDARWAPYLDGLDVPAGMVALGDFVEVPEGRSASGAMRGIADRDGTTFGWLAKAGPGGMVVMLLVSASETDSYVTVMSPASAGMAASPPFVHRDRLSPLIGPGAVIARHKDRIKDVTGLVTVATLGDLQAQLRRLRTRTMEWRTAQAPAALLDADLRSILGGQYDSLGPKLAAKLALEIPQAKVVS